MYSSTAPVSYSAGLSAGLSEFQHSLSRQSAAQSPPSLAAENRLDHHASGHARPTVKSPFRQHYPLDDSHPLLVCCEEYHSGYSHDASGSKPLAHRRQHFVPVLLQSFSNRTLSPTRLNPFSEQMPLNGDGRISKTDSPRSGLAGWWSGSAVTGATDDASGLEAKRSARDRADGWTDVNGSSDRAKGGVAATTASKFISAFSRFTQSPATPDFDDELCNINIEAALFPQEASFEPDTFSPAAFTALRKNATGLLTRMQSAYRERVRAMRQMEVEQRARIDEHEEAVTRARHLKMQLEEMSGKVQNYKKTVQQLREDLAIEKKARAEEECMARHVGLPALMTDGSIMSEDLEVETDQRRMKWRASGGTAKSDGSFETDEESMESESVFSRSRSPTLAPNTFDGVSTDGFASQSRGRLLAPPLPRQDQPMSGLRKMLKGISGDTVTETGSVSCRNCRGQHASVAWDTVSLLKEENKQLKHRTAELEVAVEDALDAVNAMGYE